MSDNSTIQDEAPARKYFTQMLNMAEDDLDPFQYRLLAHYIRWYENKPYPESIRQTAKATKMGVNKVQSTLDELSQLGYLEVYRPTAAEARNGATITIKVVDRWLENINRYQRKPVSNPIHPVSNSIQACIENDTPPVSNQIRLEEQKNEEHKSGAQKRGDYPKRLSEWKQQEMDRYYTEHVTDLDALVEAWGYNSRFKDQTLTERRLFVQCYRELNDIAFPVENYTSLGSFTRAKLGWKGAGIKPTEMLGMVEEWRNSRLQDAPRKKTAHERMIDELKALPPEEIIPPLMRFQSDKH